MNMRLMMFEAGKDVASEHRFERGCKSQYQQVRYL